MLRCHGEQVIVDEVKALYASAPEDFVAERTALVRRLKQDKRKDDAAAIAKLRRPKAAEHLLNRLSRQDPDVVADWAAAVAAARDAQSAAIGGASGDDLRTATAAVNVATKKSVDAASHLDPDVRREDLVAVLRTLIAADSTGMLTSGVVGSEGVLAPADLFAGAPEPPQRAPRKPSAKSPPNGSTLSGASSSTAEGASTEPNAVGAPQPEGHPAPQPEPEPEPEPEPVRRPSAAEIRRRTKLIADYQRSLATLQAAKASASAAESRLDVAREALAKAESAAAKRRDELEEAEVTVQRLSSEVAELDPPA